MQHLRACLRAIRWGFVVKGIAGAQSGGVVGVQVPEEKRSLNIAQRAQHHRAALIYRDEDVAGCLVQALF
jgi:hypothetical protein